MPKKARTRRKTPQADVMTLPSAENAKWLAFGFLASVVLVSIVCLIIFKVAIH